MFNVNAAIHSASNAVVNHTDLAIAKLLKSGNLRTRLKAKTLLGLWLIQSNAQSAENQLKRIKDATTWHVKCVHMSFAGYAKVNGLNMDRKQVAITIAISMKNLNKKEIKRYLKMSKNVSLLRMS